MAKAKPQTYILSVQRRETSGAGRWREIASWQVTTSETDQFGPLNCGLRENYRILISDAPPPAKDPINVSSSAGPDHPHRVDTPGEEAG
jgi:hypothetical protein